MARAPCCERMGLNRGPWTPAEDQILVAFILRYGHGNWRALPKQAGLLRCGKSCRLRWANYLRPDIKRGNFSKEEEDAIIKLHEQLGNRWSAIAARLPGRTDNEIKNVWHTTLKKRIMKPNPADKEPNKSYEAQSQPTTLKLKASATAHQSYEAPGLVPASPPLTCSDLSSSETDSSSVGRENNTDSAINEEYAVSSGELMEMDENFWSEVWSLVTGSEVLPFSSIEDAGFANSPGSGDEMDFWRRVLMESGEFWPSCLLSD